MFAAMIAPPLVISNCLDLPPDLRAAMLIDAMLGCGIGMTYARRRRDGAAHAPLSPPMGAGPARSSFCARFHNTSGVCQGGYRPRCKCQILFITS